MLHPSHKLTCILQLLDLVIPPSFLICSHWLTHTILLSYWLTQSAHILMLSSYWFSLLNLSLLHMSRLRSQEYACWKHNFCQFERGVPCLSSPHWLEGGRCGGRGRPGSAGPAAAQPSSSGTHLLQTGV